MGDGAEFVALGRPVDVEEEEVMAKMGVFADGDEEDPLLLLDEEVEDVDEDELVEVDESDFRDVFEFLAEAKLVKE